MVVSLDYVVISSLSLGAEDWVLLKLLPQSMVGELEDTDMAGRVTVHTNFCHRINSSLQFFVLKNFFQMFSVELWGKLC